MEAFRLVSGSVAWPTGIGFEPWLALSLEAGADFGTLMNSLVVRSDTFSRVVGGILILGGASMGSVGVAAAETGLGIFIALMGGICLPLYGIQEFLKRVEVRGDRLEYVNGFRRQSVAVSRIVGLDLVRSGPFGVWTVVAVQADQRIRLKATQRLTFPGVTPPTVSELRRVIGVGGE